MVNEAKNDEAVACRILAIFLIGFRKHYMI